MRKRRAISGLLQVAMIVGIVIIFAGILFAFAGDIFDAQTTAGSVSLQKILIQGAGADSYLSANVKNTGNSEITALSVKIMLDTDSGTAGMQPFTQDLSPLPLAPGMTASVHALVVDSAGDAMAVTAGTEVAALIEAATAGGSRISEPVTVRAR